VSRSISAYDDDARVARYDADMDLMHPNRHKMVEIALEVLPFDRAAGISALDLGIGTGFFAMRFLETWPAAKLTGVDGSESMIRMARRRLRNLENRVTFVTSSFEELESNLPGDSHYDVVLSSYALHHLAPGAKLRVLSGCVSRMRPAGWLLNADLVRGSDERIERRIQEIRIDGIVRRSEGVDSRFPDANSVRRFIGELEEKEHDQPVLIEDDLRILREAGITNATVFWQEYREIVAGGFKV